MDELWDDYFLYLLWRCGLERFTEYEKLFKILHGIEFVWFIERDDNREADGIELRDDYEIPVEYLDFEDDFRDHWCSVLEMMIALSIRVDDEIIGDPSDERPEDFFMEMIKNLRLDKFKNRCCNREDVLKIIYCWLDRDFEKDGRGSPFPTKYDPRDQRKIEIWDQMNSYISENYYN